MSKSNEDLIKEQKDIVNKLKEEIDSTVTIYNISFGEDADIKIQKDEFDEFIKTYLDKLDNDPTNANAIYQNIILKYGQINKYIDDKMKQKEEELQNKTAKILKNKDDADAKAKAIAEEAKAKADADAKAKAKAVENEIKNEFTELKKFETYLSDSQKDKDILIPNKKELIDKCKNKINSAKKYLDDLNNKIKKNLLEKNADINELSEKIKENHTQVINTLRNFKTKNNDFALKEITEQINEINNIIENDTLELQVSKEKETEYNQIFQKYNLITDEYFDNTEQAEYSREISLIFKDARNYLKYNIITKIYKKYFKEMNILLNDFEDPKNKKNTNENQKIINENEKIINSLKDKSNVQEIEKKNKDLQNENNKLKGEINNLTKVIDGFFNNLEQFKIYINTAVYDPDTNTLRERKSSYDYEKDYNTYKKNYEDSNIKLDKLVNNVKDVNDELIKINVNLKDIQKAEKDKLVLNILNLVTNDMKEKEKQKKKDQDQEKLSQDSLLRKEFFEKEKLKRIEEENLRKETLANKYNTIFLNSLKLERDEINTKILEIDKELENPSIDINYRIKLEKEKEELNIVLKKINKFLDDKPSFLSNVSLPSLENISSIFSWFSNPTQKLKGSREPAKPSTYIDLFLGNSILNPELNDLIVQDIRVVKQHNNVLKEAIQDVDTLFAFNKLNANRKTLKSGIESEKGKTFKKRIKIEYNKQLSKREQELKNLYKI